MKTTELTLNQIISTSGDSTLLSYKYENQVLEFTLHHFELDRNILFKVETSELRVLLHENYPNDTTSKTCFIELIELTKVLQVANHHYIPSTDFGKLMQECKAGLNLVYGKKVEDNKYFLSLKGSETILCCVLSNLSKFTFQLVN
ncbi:MAG: hypothetical protein KA146_10525 [Leptospiraceae bacterium]|nr:hypothetical protein [Leptospiraceae bacterium]